MQVRNLKKLRSLIVIQERTHREIAQAAGWKSHSYVSRLLRGEVNTLAVEPAVAIARLLGCPLEELFTTRLTTNPDHFDRQNRKRSA